MNSYILILGISGTVILSYFFNFISKKTKIPGVLMLIALGVTVNYSVTGMDKFDGLIFPLLEILGTVGLIMIVLEAALDLKLEKKKKGLIIRSFLAAIGILLITVFLVACILNFLLGMDPIIALVHAVPLSIMSSAIIIPSVASLTESKKEFMIYESTFSDILGIMLFYFLIDSLDKSGPGEIALSISLNIVITLIAAVVIGFVMIWIFQRVKSTVGLFFLISLLIFVYSFGKMFHLSSLIIILVFGLLLNNHKLFFLGPLKKLIQPESFQHLYNEFKVVIEESAFVVRTFFFVIFGMSIDLMSMADLKVIFISIVLLAIMYGVRYFNLKFITKSDKIFPELFIAPRGLITVLLFYAIPEELMTPLFDKGILLIVILGTSLIMMFGIIKNKEGEANQLSVDDEHDPVSDEPIFPIQDQIAIDDQAGQSDTPKS